MARTKKQNAMDVLQESFTELREDAKKRMTKKEFAQAEKGFGEIVGRIKARHRVSDLPIDADWYLLHERFHELWGRVKDVTPATEYRPAIKAGLSAILGIMDRIQQATKKSRQNEIMMALQAVDAKDRLKRIAEIIEIVDDRCTAADGPVTKTQLEITTEEFREIYKLASQEKRVSTAIKVTVSNSMYMAEPPVIGKKFYVHITKGHQHFRLDYDGNKEECEWMAHMLRIALSSGDAGSTQDMLRDAGQLIRRLMHRITKDNPALPRPKILAQADGWLKRRGLQGSILRDTEWRAEDKR